MGPAKIFCPPRINTKNASSEIVIVVPYAGGLSLIKEKMLPAVKAGIIFNDLEIPRGVTPYFYISFFTLMD
jgi:hypothetical protein